MSKPKISRVAGNIGQGLKSFGKDVVSEAGEAVKEVVNTALGTKKKSGSGSGTVNGDKSDLKQQLEQLTQSNDQAAQEEISALQESILGGGKQTKQGAKRDVDKEMQEVRQKKKQKEKKEEEEEFLAKLQKQREEEAEAAQQDSAGLPKSSKPPRGSVLMRRRENKGTGELGKLKN